MAKPTNTTRPVLDYMNVKVPKDVLEALDRALQGRKDGLTRSRLVRALVQAWLDDDVPSTVLVKYGVSPA